MQKTQYLTSPYNRQLKALKKYLLKVDAFDLERITVVQRMINDITEERQKSINYAKEPEFIVLTKIIKEHLVINKGCVTIETGMGSFSDKIMEDKITAGE